jgi:hypothetical protein
MLPTRPTAVPAAKSLFGRPCQACFGLATVFTASGAFLAAYGAGVGDGLVEAAGGTLLGLATLACMIGFRRIAEPGMTAAPPWEGDRSATPQA